MLPLDNTSFLPGKTREDISKLNKYTNELIKHPGERDISKIYEAVVSISNILPEIISELEKELSIARDMAYKEQPDIARSYIEREPLIDSMLHRIQVIKTDLELLEKIKPGILANIEHKTHLKIFYHAFDQIAERLRQ